MFFFVSDTGDNQDLHGRTHTFPTRRSSDLLDQRFLLLHVAVVLGIQSGLQAGAERREAFLLLLAGKPVHRRAAAPLLFCIAQSLDDRLPVRLFPVGARLERRQLGKHGIALPQTLRADERSEEHTSELQSLMRISYAVFCLKKKKRYKTITKDTTYTYEYK